MNLILIIFTIALAIILALKIKTSNKNTRFSKEAFLENEVKANNTRKQSIDDLDYITIPINKLPFCDNSDEDIINYQNQIKTLSKKKIINLAGQSNTELKLAYGAANLDILTAYENNFVQLIHALNKWGEKLYTNGNINEAAAVLEFAVECKSDLSKTYTLLAQIYAETNHTEKINNLISTAQTLESLMKNSIIRNLNAFLPQSDHTDE